MTNLQNLGAIIVKLMEEERNLKTAYDEYSKADKAVQETEEKVKAIKEALKALRNAFDTIERLGL